MNKGNKKSCFLWAKVALVSAAILVVIGFCIDIPSILLKNVLGPIKCSIWGDQNHHTKLSSRPDSINTAFYQGKVPSKEEKIKGKAALNKWKSATRDEQRYLIDDIILGNSLIGLSYDEIESYFGHNFLETKDCKTTHFMRYSMPNNASSTELVIQLNPSQSDGSEAKVDDVYLSVNF